jgi:hypothetical protein
MERFLNSMIHLLQFFDPRPVTDVASRSSLELICR